MRRAAMLTAAVVLLTAACAAGGGQPGSGSSPSAEPTPAFGSEPVKPRRGTLTGTLGGDAELEGGCAWLDDGKLRWLVQYPEGYRVAFDPVSVTAPNGETAHAGDTITVEGSEARDVMTTCQVGPVWAASSVTLGE